MDVARELCRRFNCRQVAVTLRESISANDNRWSAMLYEKERACFSRAYLMHIVDRVGGGDSFGGALIYALRDGYTQQEAIEFDFNQATVDEVLALINGDAIGRVKR